MCGVDAAALGGARGKRGNLVHVGGRVGRVEQARGEAGGTVLHRLVDVVEHGADLHAGGAAANVGHGGEPEGGMADEGRDIDGGHGVGDGAGVAGEARERVGRPRPEQVHGRGRIVGEPHGREADSAVAGDDRGHALADLGPHVGLVEQDTVVVGVRVDEAGGKRPAAEVMFRPAAAAGDRAGAADERDALARHRKLARNRCAARSVVQHSVPEDVIVGGRASWVALLAGRRYF